MTNSHGYVRNGKFDGLLGDLHNGLVEIGGTVTLPVAFRMLALRYTGFHIPMRCVLVLCFARSFREALQIFNTVLEPRAWCCRCAAARWSCSASRRWPTRTTCSGCRSRTHCGPRR